MKLNAGLNTFIESPHAFQSDCLLSNINRSWKHSKGCNLRSSLDRILIWFVSSDSKLHFNFHISGWSILSDPPQMLTNGWPTRTWAAPPTLPLSNEANVLGRRMGPVAIDSGSSFLLVMMFWNQRWSRWSSGSQGWDWFVTVYWIELICHWSSYSLTLISIRDQKL